MTEYLGNAFEDIAKALNENPPRDRIVLYRGQMEQIIRVHAEVTEAKNVVVREIWQLTHPNPGESPDGR